jgi:aryl-alcohol dehydrogenase-like predicted oxidoreductase
MPFRKLGRTGVEVSVLAYGGLELYGHAFRGQRGIAADEADAVLRALLESGINYVDTSPDYGQSESYLGEYLSAHRDDWFVASKCGCQVGAREVSQSANDTHDYHPATIIAAAEQSLRRLQTDHLDLVQLHMNPSRTVLESTGAVEALLDLQQQGKTRFIGCSSGLPELMDHIDMGVFDVFQLPYSGLDREHEHAISVAAGEGSGVVIRGSFGTERPSAASRPKRLDWHTLESDVFVDLRGGMSVYEFMLRFTISHPDVTAAIIGTKRPVALASNVAAATRGRLPPDVYENAKRLFDLLGSNAT